MVASSGFSRYSPQQPQVAGAAERSRTLLDVIRDLDGASTELVERNKTIFFPHGAKRRKKTMKNNRNFLKNQRQARQKSRRAAAPYLEGARKKLEKCDF